jgi:hypothetical protein
MVKLGSEWKQIDPRSWNADMDVQVNVMLGSGLTEDKLAMLEAIIAKQEMVMGMLGPSNPLTGLMEYRNALGDAISLRGRKDVERYFKPFGPTQAQAMADAAAQAEQNPKPESPEQIIAQAQIQIEQMRVQREMAIKQAELELKTREINAKLEMDQRKLAMEMEQEMLRIRLEDDRERDKASQELALKREEIEAKYATKVTEAEIKAEATANRETTQSEG